jgi:F-type H+-transporting ATPase subunit b
MLSYLTHVSSTEVAEESFFEQLGIDWTLLVLQGLAFLVLVFLLGKFVYPVFLRIIDERQAKIEESTKHAEIASKKAQEAELNVEKTLKAARKDAADIIATAKAEVAQMTEAADKKAKSRAERIVADANAEIDKSILAAKKSLEKDTLKLVKQAATIATSNVADSKFDDELVQKSIKEVTK